MKKRIFVLALCLCALLTAGCTKDASKDIIGSYTYKTSGTVTLMATQLIGLDEATLAMYRQMGINVDPVVVGLYPEQGQMHIIDTDNGKVTVTFNDLLGNADVATGRVDGSVITLDEGQVKAAQLTDGSDKMGAGIVSYTGKGAKYDDMLIIDLEYQGQFTVQDVPMTVIASDVHCVAQQN
ncbi:MAG: hypothetical protein Q4G10_07730 [Bacteroidia bacterium]|nr:hypothetical protein [Bacteroidia bacterium]